MGITSINLSTIISALSFGRISIAIITATRMTITIVSMGIYNRLKVAYVCLGNGSYTYHYLLTNITIKPYEYKYTKYQLLDTSVLIS